MAKKLYEESNIYDIACAIREKCGGTDTYKTCDMPDAIRALSSGAAPNILPLTVTTNGTFNVPADVDGYNPVTVTVASGGNTAVEDGLVNGQLTGHYSNDRVTDIWSYAFMGLSKMTSASFPNVVSVRSNAFNSCSKLADIALPKAETLAGSAFYCCAALEKLDLPKCYAISSSCFSGCASLTALILRNTETVTIGSSPFATIIVGNNTYACPITLGTGYIYVPRALVDTYKANASWSAYANQIRAIEDYPDICG